MERSSQQQQDAEGVSGAAACAIGVTAIGASYLLQYLYNITAERAVNFKRTPKFSNFGSELKNFLSNQPNQEAMVLVEGCVEQYDNKTLTSLKGQLSGAGKVVVTTEYFKSKVENTDTWQDASRTTENVRISVPFALRDSCNNVIVVESVHNATGFNEMLHLAYQEHLTDKGKTMGDFATGMTLQEIPVSISIQEYLLIFGTKFGGYGRAALQSGSTSSWWGGSNKIIKFYPEEIGSSVKGLIDSQEMVERVLRWLSWVFFVGGGFVIVFFAAPCIWRFLQGRRSSRRSSLNSITE